MVYIQRHYHPLIAGRSKNYKGEPRGSADFVDAPAIATADNFAALAKVTGLTNVTGAAKVTGLTNVTGAAKVSGAAKPAGVANITGAANPPGVANITGAACLGGSGNISSAAGQCTVPAGALGRLIFLSIICCIQFLAGYCGLQPVLAEEGSASALTPASAGESSSGQENSSTSGNSSSRQSSSYEKSSSEGESPSAGESSSTCGNSAHCAPLATGNASKSVSAKSSDSAFSSPFVFTEGPGLQGKHWLDGREIASLPSDTTERLKNFTPFSLPPEPPEDHEVNKILDLGPIRESTLLNLTKTRPIRLEASYNEPLSLAEALDYALTNNLPIKISRESLNFQRFQFIAQAVDVLPNFSTGFSAGQASINTNTTAYNRIFSAGLRYPVFQGGAVLYSALSQYYRQKGWISSYRATINDALLDVYQKYQNLVLNNAILQIRAKSLAISESQLALNNAIFKSGTGTQFAIMQSRTQLASDRQALLAQQVLLRQAAMALAFALNVPMAINLIPSTDLIKEEAIFDRRATIKDVLDQTMLLRPELRQYECFRMAAARNVQAAASSLYPQASFFTTYTHSAASVFPPQNVGALNGLASATINSSLFGSGLASNTALNQAASFSPTGNNLGNSGVNTVATVVAASGGNPIATTQSGSLVTSGAVAPSFASGSSAFGSGGSNINGSNTAGAGVFPGLFNNFQAGFSIAWSLSNLGSNAIVGIGSARALARQAMLQANQEILLVTEQARSSYLTTITAREQIDSAAHGVASTTEALRLANLRLAAGTGTNLEMIQAQRDYVAALINQAQAIVASNQAQVQLLHDSGLISRETILSGWQRSDLPAKPKKRKWRP